MKQRWIFECIEIAFESCCFVPCLYLKKYIKIMKNGNFFSLLVKAHPVYMVLWAILEHLDSLVSTVVTELTVCN